MRFILGADVDNWMTALASAEIFMILPPPARYFIHIGA
jgi:hypothetical protein